MTIYRALTEKEVARIIADNQDYAAWEAWTSTLLLIFPTLKTIEIEVGSEYDDEGGYFNTVESFYLADEKGEEPEPDLDGPGIRAFIREHHWNSKMTDEEVEAEIAEIHTSEYLSSEGTYERTREWLRDFMDPPCPDAHTTYTVGEPPKGGIQTLYVAIT